MNLQHLNLKIFTKPGAEKISFETYIPIFHSWIQKKVTEEMLIDVADYAHVPEGPGVLLIGHQAYVSIDNIGGRLGLLYNRKVKEEGTNAEKIRRILKLALQHAKRLAEEETVRGKLQFDFSNLQWVVNDRLLAPHTEENFKDFTKELQSVLGPVYGNAEMKASAPSDSRQRLTVDLKISGDFSVDELLKKLS